MSEISPPHEPKFQKGDRCVFAYPVGIRKHTPPSVVDNNFVIAGEPFWSEYFNDWQYPIVGKANPTEEKYLILYNGQEVGDIIEQNKFSGGGLTPNTKNNPMDKLPHPQEPNTPPAQPGGLLVGNSHSQGGIKIKTPEGQIEAEGGETILNKRSMASGDVLEVKGTPKEIASAINEYKGGVTFEPGAELHVVEKNDIAQRGLDIKNNSMNTNGIKFERDENYVSRTKQPGYNFQFEDNLGRKATGIIKFNKAINEFDVDIDETYGTFPNTASDPSYKSVRDLVIQEFNPALDEHYNTTKFAWGGIFSSTKKEESASKQHEIQKKIKEFSYNVHNVREDYRHGDISGAEYADYKQKLINEYSPYISQAPHYGIHVNPADLMISQGIKSSGYTRNVGGMAEEGLAVQQARDIVSSERARMKFEAREMDKLFKITSMTDRDLPVWYGKVVEIEKYIIENKALIPKYNPKDDWETSLFKFGLVANEVSPALERDLFAARGSVVRSTDPNVRPSPSVSATIYPEGFKMEGNDGNLWEIHLSGTGIHRWVKVKEEFGGVLAEDGYWIKDAIQHPGILRNKAKHMGLIHGDQKLSEADLQKIERLGGKWDDRVRLARKLKSFKHKAADGIEIAECGCELKAEDGKEIVYNEKVYQALLEEAKADKLWAQNISQDQEWLANASDMSKEMVNDYQTKSLEQMAKDSYRYLYYRAHMQGDSGMMTGHYIDKAAKDKWEELSGEKLAAKGKLLDTVYTDQKTGVKYWVEQRNLPGKNKDLWTVFSTSPGTTSFPHKWTRRDEMEGTGFVTEQDAINSAKIYAGVMKETDPEAYFMNNKAEHGTEVLEPGSPVTAGSIHKDAALKKDKYEGIKVGLGVFDGKELWRLTHPQVSGIGIYPKHLYTEAQAKKAFYEKHIAKTVKPVFTKVKINKDTLTILFINYADMRIARTELLNAGMPEEFFEKTGKHLTNLKFINWAEFKKAIALLGLEDAKAEDGSDIAAKGKDVKRFVSAKVFDGETYYTIGEPDEEKALYNQQEIELLNNGFVIELELRAVRNTKEKLEEYLKEIQQNAPEAQLIFSNNEFGGNWRIYVKDKAEDGTDIAAKGKSVSPGIVVNDLVRVSDRLDPLNGATARVDVIEGSEAMITYASIPEGAVNIKVGDSDWFRIKHLRKIAEAGVAIATDVKPMTFEEFSIKLPEIKSPYVGEEDVVYKPKYNTYAGRMSYFKHGRKNLTSLSTAAAYVHYFYDQYGIRFRDLDMDEKKRLSGKHAPMYKLDHFEDGGNIISARNIEIAGNIIQQLGGPNVLRMMTGAYGFAAIENGLSFRIKNPSANYIKIVLNGNDYYDVEIGRVRGATYKKLLVEEDVPVENLKKTLEEDTGLYFSLYKDGGEVTAEEKEQFTQIIEAALDNNVTASDKNFTQWHQELFDKTKISYPTYQLQTAYEILSSRFDNGGELTDIAAELTAFDLNDLDEFERREYDHAIKSMPKEEALQVIINTVEGDYTQLSPKLAELAEKQDPQEFGNGGPVNNKKVDLFEHPDLIPAKVQKILDKHAEEFGDSGDYRDTQRLLDEIEKVGYTFEYYLDNTPYGLRKKGVALNELEGYEEMENGGAVNPKDTITMDIPLLIRTLEMAREDIKSDADLHKMVERLIELKDKGTLTMDDYDFIENVKAHPVMIAANGAQIPERYKAMGFTKVGQKKQSTRPGKKWMVLAKKGDQYKVVHGGFKGMQDYSQHHSAERRQNFWNRMGGIDSAKANDSFSPLYWHKKFGTWEDGGPINGYREDVLEAIRSYDDHGWYYVYPKDVLELVKNNEIYAHDLNDDTEFEISSSRTDAEIQELIDSAEFGFFSESKIDGYDHPQIFAQGGPIPGEELYFVDINYQSTSGNPITVSDYVFAKDEHSAIEKLEKKVKARKNFMKLDGGSALKSTFQPKAEDGVYIPAQGKYLVEVIGQELEKDGGRKFRWVKEIKADNAQEAEQKATDDFYEKWKLSDLSFNSAKVITNPTPNDVVKLLGTPVDEEFAGGGKVKPYPLIHIGKLEPEIDSIWETWHPPYEVYQAANKIWAKADKIKRGELLKKYVPEYADFDEMKQLGHGTAILDMPWSRIGIGPRRDIATGLHNEHFAAKGKAITNYSVLVFDVTDGNFSPKLDVQPIVKKYTKAFVILDQTIYALLSDKQEAALKSELSKWPKSFGNWKNIELDEIEITPSADAKKLYWGLHNYDYAAAGKVIKDPVKAKTQQVYKTLQQSVEDQKLTNGVVSNEQILDDIAKAMAPAETEVIADQGRLLIRLSGNQAIDVNGFAISVLTGKNDSKHYALNEFITGTDILVKWKYDGYRILKHKFNGGGTITKNPESFPQSLETLSDTLDAISNDLTDNDEIMDFAELRFALTDKTNGKFKKAVKFIDEFQEEKLPSFQSDEMIKKITMAFDVFKASGKKPEAKKGNDVPSIETIEEFYASAESKGQHTTIEDFVSRGILTTDQADSLLGGYATGTSAKDKHAMLMRFAGKKVQGGTLKQFQVRVVVDGKDTETGYDTYGEAKDKFDEEVLNYGYQVESSKSDYAIDPENEDNWIELYKVYGQGGELNEYDVTGGGFAEPHRIKAKTKREAIEEAIVILRPIFGTQPKNKFKAEKVNN